MKIPGPKARKIIARDEKIISPSYTRCYPLVIKKAKGAIVEDVDGNKFLDFTSGIGVCSTGHSHPKVVKAIQEQAARFLHMSGTDFYYDLMPLLAEKLIKITPGNFPKRVFFGNSGAEAIECAFKLVRFNTRRTRMLAFIGAFHGRTFGALSLTASKVTQRNRFAPLVPEVTHIPYAYCYRCPYNLVYPDCEFHCVKFIEEVLFKSVIPPEEVAAIIVEPIQGEGGYIIPPAGYHEALIKLCHKYGILYVADEIQSGMGRTGKMFAIEHWKVIPDCLCIAKGVASGMPIGITVSKAEIMNWGKGSHASTFGGNPVSCAAALTTIELIEKELVDNAKHTGDYFIGKLKELMKKSRIIGDVRGKGLMIGVEIVKDKATKEKGSKEREEIIQNCFQKGLLLLGCGENTVRFVPPLIITKAEVDKAIEIFSEEIKKIEEKQ